MENVEKNTNFKNVKIRYKFIVKLYKKTEINKNFHIKTKTSLHHERLPKPQPFHIFFRQTQFLQGFQFFFRHTQLFRKFHFFLRQNFFFRKNFIIFKK